MKLHEYQSKSLFAAYGIPIPKGDVAVNPGTVSDIAKGLGGAVVIKAQVLVGGRGKAGGIRLVATPDEAAAVAADILGAEIKGLLVREVLVEEAVGIQQELYLGVVVDRVARRPVMMTSAQGGVEIEEVARTSPDAIRRIMIDPLVGFAGSLALAEGVGLRKELYVAFDGIARSLYNAFLTCDALLAEINPLVITDKGLLALDGKMVIDDNALFRHSGLAQMRNASEETPAEREAREAGLSYVYLGGNIGCLVNGAGLAMATMDVIRLFGGSPADFLDVGGGARAEQIAMALRLILNEPGLDAVLLNIFGGITRCDEVARGIVTALEKVQPGIPLVVRLVGTNEEQGRRILNDSGHRLIVAHTLAEAAQKAVAVAKDG